MGEAERLRAERDELRRELGALATAEASLQQRICVALRAFDEAQAWEGWTSCVDYLVHVFGWAPSEARERLRVARALERLQKTDRALAAGEISFAKARKVSRVGDPANESTLIGLAVDLPTPQLGKALARLEQQIALGSPEENASDPAAAARRRLAARRLTLKPLQGGLSRVVADVLDEELDLVKKALDVQAEAEHGGPDRTVEPLSPAEHRRQRVDRFMSVFRGSLEEAQREASEPIFGRYDVLVHVTPEDLELGSAGGASWLQSGLRLSGDAARRLSCAGGRTDLLVKDLESRPSAVLDVGRKSRGPTRALLKALWARDRGCRFPGCCNWRYVDTHHVRHWADGGPTSLANLMLLCSTHHAYLHEGGYSVTAEAGVFVFRDPDGRVIHDGQGPPRVDPRITQGVEDSIAHAKTTNATVAEPFDLGAAGRLRAVVNALRDLDLGPSLQLLREHRARDQVDGWRARRRGGDRSGEGSARPTQR
ncbi:MAG: HNH endonuclease [Planctomycetota bacterium]